MTPLTIFTATTAPLPSANVDTDQIIPARFLLRSRRADYAALLFHDHRFGPEGAVKDFVLNHANWKQAGILVAGENFGCGSAREQAVWAFVDFGIRGIIAPSFGTIFRGNCTRNGILAACVDPSRMTPLWQTANEAGMLTADLHSRTIRCPNGQEIAFEIPDADRDRLLNGLDDVAITLQYRRNIGAVESRQRRDRPWAGVRAPDQSGS